MKKQHYINKFDVPKNIAMFFIIAASFLFVAFYLFLFGDSVYWWTDDSASYIEAARNFSSKGELVISTGVDTLVETAPIRLWPPGYPLILSYFQDITGVDSQWMSVFLSITSWALIPIMIFVIISPLAGNKLSILISLIALTSPGLVSYGWKGLSDSLFFLIVLLGMFFSLKPSISRNRFIYLFIGGVLLGSTFAIRNLGAAALMAVFISFLISLIINKSQRKQLLLEGFIWGGGALIIVVPVFIRNLLIFNTLQPYSMPPSTAPLSLNINHYLHASLLDVFGSWKIADIITSNIFSILFILVICLSIIFFVKGPKYIKGNLLKQPNTYSENATIITSFLIYAILSITIIIYARTKYEWGEFINLRHVMQYNWIFLTVIFFVICNNIKKPFGVVIVYLLSGLILLGHFKFAIESVHLKINIKSSVSQSQHEILTDKQLKKELIELSKEFFVATNMSAPIRISTSMPVHRLYLKTDENIRENITQIQKLISTTGKKAKIFIFLPKERLDTVVKLFDSIYGVEVERRNESLIVFHVSPLSR